MSGCRSMRTILTALRWVTASKWALSRACWEFRGFTACTAKGGRVSSELRERDSVDGLAAGQQWNLQLHEIAGLPETEAMSKNWPGVARLPLRDLDGVARNIGGA